MVKGGSGIFSGKFRPQKGKERKEKRGNVAKIGIVKNKRKEKEERKQAKMGEKMEKRKEGKKKSPFTTGKGKKPWNYSSHVDPGPYGFRSN